MIVVAQRVSRAEVLVAGEQVGAIERGLCLLTCALAGDTVDAIEWLADKVADLRLFPDDEGRTNLSLLDVAGGALVVPQFTLAADWRKGRRPSFTRAAPPVEGERAVRRFAERLALRGVPVAGGRFGALMTVPLVNDGPFTLVLDSDLKRPRSDH